MANKRTAQDAREAKPSDLLPLVAASLAGTIYQARLFNRQARMNVPDASVISEVLSLWETVLDALDRRPK
jgi:hypothetical protein